MIIDSSRAYFGSSIDIVSFVRSLVNYADQIGKNGVTVLADMGSFFCYNKLNDLIEYETSLQRTSGIKAKGFCLYNRDDFNWRLTYIQKKKLLEHHGRELMIATSPTIKWLSMTSAICLLQNRIWLCGSGRQNNAICCSTGLWLFCLPKDTTMFLKSSRCFKSKILIGAMEVDEDYRLCDLS